MIVKFLVRMIKKEDHTFLGDDFQKEFSTSAKAAEFVRQTLKESKEALYPEIYKLDSKATIENYEAEPAYLVNGYEFGTSIVDGARISEEFDDLKKACERVKRMSTQNEIWIVEVVDLENGDTKAQASKGGFDFIER